MSTPPAKNATFLLSGDQNGNSAPVVSSSGTASIESRERIQRPPGSFGRFARNTTSLPSGDTDTVTEGTIVPVKVNSVFGGGPIVNRASGTAPGAGRMASASAIASAAVAVEAHATSANVRPRATTRLRGAEVSDSDGWR